ncbi:oxysterol-binding protein-related protein 10-like isoform X2 [Scleropages formosus]|uniref:oxysterol-binding protein-related protein 10-like isoform X2 n=1 Tax=Scleropages formosus TaxID=113540 RepID=UPI0010FA7F64|nr:oxysterol-binding protein-related protein 10-like isoform X2 [Scleropages formosus]
MIIMDRTGAQRSKPGSPAPERGTSVSSDGGTGSGSPRLLSAGSPAGAEGRSRGCNACGQQAQRRHLEGVLSKYTNLLQGWQNRYFVLDPDQGHLQYYVSEQGKGQKPRGSLPLLGATVDPSDEVPHMFTVHSASGELYKLKAVDTREQQFWMNHLQASARRHSDSSARVGKMRGFDEHLCLEKMGGCQDGQGSSSSGRVRSFSLLPAGCPSPGIQRRPPQPVAPSNIVTVTHHKSPAAARRAKSPFPGRLLEVKEVEGQQRDLVQSIESLPAHGPVSCLDQDLLLLKATSTATLGCLGECLNILQRSAGQVVQHDPPSDEVSLCPGSESPPTGSPKSCRVTALSCPEAKLPPWRSSPVQPAQVAFLWSQCLETEAIGLSEELTDTENNEEEDLGVMEEQRSVILHLLSQLKLGMDLTRVVLPTFILEKRSLLEMYANFMAHPDMFLAITAATSAEDRMVRFVEYYLTAFHEGRRGAVARKPYNPLLGETFHCSWEVPRERSGPTGCYRVRFVAEQVSHHPPVSGFYCECRERGMCVNAHVWTKSKFMGMSIGVSMVGEGMLCLMEHGEEYVFTLPNAYARSILTVPWVELAGKVSISCAKSSYSASITFQSKPFYGGKVHRVTAEVKHGPSGAVVCKAQGEWNGTLEFTYSSGETRVIDTTTLPVTRKKIRPLEKQGSFESRRLWQHVTVALKKGDLDVATEHKRHLEEKQRAEERQREATATPWIPRHFRKEGDGWVYRNPLWKAN